MHGVSVCLHSNFRMPQMNIPESGRDQFEDLLGIFDSSFIPGFSDIMAHPDFHRLTLEIPSLHKELLLSGGLGLTQRDRFRDDLNPFRHSFETSLPSSDPIKHKYFPHPWLCVIFLALVILMVFECRSYRKICEGRRYLVTSACRRYLVTSACSVLDTIRGTRHKTECPRLTPCDATTSGTGLIDLGTVA
eukprot:Gregarina_sp_Poly_1__6831@NODE_369_length_9158_cov_93_280497_g305_i0_p7_GENE_NODE_369_length_9158_cov_93_280497_g305_i0NODE_369_length_9158_cov_93_280497_g305_i0_p7_ORF_typecomplete_len190_score4_62_NODE_369_length_9158_cov_93_280497_g305_i020922661